MKNLRITVNGREYDVQVEEVGNPSSKSEIKESPAVSNNNETKDASTAKKELTGSDIVKAPMPGTILSVNVKEGQIVSSGDVLLVLEAMKMENEIMAPRDGVIAQVNVNKGESVESGSPLISLQ